MTIAGGNMKLTKRQLQRIIREAIHYAEHDEKLEAKMDLDVTKPVGESKQVYSVRILEDFDFVYGYDQADEKDLHWYIPKGGAYVCYATDPGYPAEYVLVSVERRRFNTRRLYVPIEEEDLERYEREGVLEYYHSK